MNNQAFLALESDEILTKDHYFSVLGHSGLIKLSIKNHSHIIGNTVSYNIENDDYFDEFFERVSMNEFSLLSNEDIITNNHFCIWESIKDPHDKKFYPIIRRTTEASIDAANIGEKVRNACSKYEYLGKKLQINFYVKKEPILSKLNILENLEL